MSVTRMIFWFAIVGWSAGWVTGRAMQCPRHSMWMDAVIGMIGGLIAGYFVHTWEAWNWGFLLAESAAALSAAALTWAVHRVKHVWLRRQHVAH